MPQRRQNASRQLAALAKKDAGAAKKLTGKGTRSSPRRKHDRDPKADAAAARNIRRKVDDSEDEEEFEDEEAGAGARKQGGSRQPDGHRDRSIADGGAGVAGEEDNDGTPTTIDSDDDDDRRCQKFWLGEKFFGLSTCVRYRNGQ